MDVCVFILNRVVSEGFHDEVGFEWRLKEEWGQPYLNMPEEHVSDRESNWQGPEIIAYWTSLRSYIV